MPQAIKKSASPKPRIRIQGRDNSELLNLLNIDWPMAQQVLDKLAAFLHITERQGVDETAQHIVERALSAYRRSVYPRTQIKHADPERIGCFIDAVITETCAVLQVHRASGNGPESTDGALAHKTALLRSSLYELLTSDRMKTVLKESNHEKTILAGRMVTGD